MFCLACVDGFLVYPDMTLTFLREFNLIVRDSGLELGPACGLISLVRYIYTKTSQHTSLVRIWMQSGSLS